MERKALECVEAALPAAWYRDPEHYRRELDAFWFDRWIAAAREEEIPSPGDWRTVRIASQSILLSRAQDGRLRAFHNVCRHRGSVLCTEEKGSFPRRRIVCPYHAWTYDLEGRLVATPRRMETPDFRLQDFPLHAVGADVWGGFVFVHLGTDPQPLARSVGRREERFKPYRFHELRIGQRVAVDVQAGGKLR